MTHLKVLSIILFGFVCVSALAQDDPITLNNPSFEDIPMQGKEPRGWFDCGFSQESPPDVQPQQGNFFKVVREAQEGSTYVGLVVRDNDTWERIAQRMSAAVESGSCYEFSVYMARSELYESLSRTTGEMANYATPAKLRIWGGNGYCDRKELLAESSLVVNTRWLKFNFRFEPKGTYNYIMLEAYYKTPTLFPYNGNILMDNASDIVKVPCDDEEPTPEPPVDEPIVETPTPPSTPDPVTETPITPTPRPVTPPVADSNKTFEGVRRSELSVGSTIRIQKLYFKADSTDFTRDSRTTLDELYEFLAANRDIEVEIGGHTNTVPPEEYCDRLSTARAESVVNYLVSRGIRSDRLKAVGYGKNRPIVKNDRNSLPARRKNQRVEVKVLKIG